MSKWKPGDDFVIRIDDKTAESRSVEQLDEMVQKARKIFNEHGFDLVMWGNWQGIRRIATKESFSIIEEKLFNILDKDGE